MSPQQIGNISAQGQQQFGTILKAMQNKQELGLRARKMQLEEQIFGRGTQAMNRKNAAIDKLSGFTAENIHKAPADVLTTINESSIGSMFTTNNSIRAGQKPTSASAPADLVMIRAMEKEVADKGLQDITETTIWKYKTAGKNKERAQQDIREAVVKSMSSNPVFATMAPDKFDQEVRHRMELITEEPAARTKTVDPFMDQVLQEFNQGKKKETLEMLGITDMPSHEVNN